MKSKNSGVKKYLCCVKVILSVMNTSICIVCRSTTELLFIARSLHFLYIHYSRSHMSYITFCFWRGQLSRQTNNISPADKEKFSSKYVNYSKIIDAISIMGQSNKRDSMKTNSIITQHLNFKNDMSLFILFYL